MKARQFFLQAITPVHIGAAQGADSVVDLPVMRERASGHPIIPASSIKGVLRGGREDDRANRIFGYASDGADFDGAAAGLVLTDARLLFLPVRSLRGTYALITCPGVLERWRRDAALLDLNQPPVVEVASDLDALVFSNSDLMLNEGANRMLVLEDYDLKADVLDNEQINRLSSIVFSKKEDQDQLKRHLAVVNCSIFDDLARNGLEVRARVQLASENKTVKEGPWYEEAVPAEAILYFFAFADDETYFHEISTKPHLLVGGGTSIGRGMVRVLGG